jgi:hypothetical protein
MVCRTGEPSMTCRPPVPDRLGGQARGGRHPRRRTRRPRRAPRVSDCAGHRSSRSPRKDAGPGTRREGVRETRRGSATRSGSRLPPPGVLGPVPARWSPPARDVRRARPTRPGRMLVSLRVCRAGRGARRRVDHRRVRGPAQPQRKFDPLFSSRPSLVLGRGSDPVGSTGSLLGRRTPARA